MTVASASAGLTNMAVASIGTLAAAARSTLRRMASIREEEDSVAGRVLARMTGWAAHAALVVDGVVSPFSVQPS